MAHKVCFCGEIRKIFIWVFILSRAVGHFHSGLTEVPVLVENNNIGIKHGFSCINIRQVPR